MFSVDRRSRMQADERLHLRDQRRLLRRDMAITFYDLSGLDQGPTTPGKILNVRSELHVCGPGILSSRQGGAGHASLQTLNPMANGELSQEARLTAYAMWVYGERARAAVSALVNSFTHFFPI
jgi:hypothetical protein